MAKPSAFAVIECHFLESDARFRSMPLSTQAVYIHLWNMARRERREDLQWAPFGRWTEGGWVADRVGIDVRSLRHHVAILTGTGLVSIGESGVLWVPGCRHKHKALKDWRGKIFSPGDPTCGSDKVERVERVDKVEPPLPPEGGTSRRPPLKIRQTWETLVRTWAERCPSQAQPNGINDGRRDAIRARLRSDPQWLTKAIEAMTRIPQSPFLRGERGRESWQRQGGADIDFLLRRDTVSKILEGKYDESRGKRGPGGVPDWATWGLETSNGHDDEATPF